MADPVLYTERLALRPLTAELAAALLAGPEDEFPTADDVQVLNGVVASGSDAHSTFVLTLEDRPVGTAGIAGGLSPDGDQEVGYGLVPDARGRGLGTEAVGALCAYLERAPGVRRLTAEVLPGNDASLRLLRRLGFVQVIGGTGGRRLLARAAPGQPDVQTRIAGKHVC